MNDGMHDLERELRQHASALRGLACALVGAGDADDVVQETALQALRTRPREPGPLVGWLLGIVRHVASRHRRTRVRRSRREQVAARDVVQLPDRSVDESDTLRFLTEAVLALPQPYRGAVFARYLRECSPAEIAAETGEPVGTVKTRLKRGLAMLRERLDAETRGRGGDWRAGLVAAFGLERATVATAAITAGGLLMTTTMKFMVGAVAAVLLIAGYVVLGPSASATGEPGGLPNAPVATGTVAGDAQSPAASAVAGAASPAPAPVQRDAVPAGAPAAKECVLRGRCVDEAGKPLAGVVAELNGWSGNDQRLDAWRKQNGEPARVNKKVEAGSDGVFEFRFWPPPPFVFALRIHGAAVATWQCMWNELAAGATEDLGDVVFAPGTLLRGRVTDADGAPVAKVLVRIERVGRQPSQRGFESYSDALTLPDGSFAARWALQAGDYTLGIDDHVLEQPALQLTGAPEQQVEIVLKRVDGDRSISGVVVDGQGAPVRSATIWPTVSGPGRIISTDEAGRFRVLRREDSPSKIGLSVQADGYDVPSIDEQFAWGRHDLRFVVTKGGDLVVNVVRASDGTPVENYVLRLAPAGLHGWSSADSRPRGGTRHAGGREVVKGLRSEPHQVVVEPEGDELAVSVVPIDVTAAGAPPVVVRLAANTMRTVRVQCSDGSPVVDAKVQLVDPLGNVVTDRVLVFTPSEMGNSNAHRAIAIAVATTDANGEATLPVPGDRPLALRLPGPGHVPEVVPAVEFPAVGALVVTVRIGARLQGRIGPEPAFAETKRLAGIVEGGDGRRAMWPTIELWRTGTAGREHFPEVSRRHAVKPDGSFDLTGIPPGRWRLVVMCMHRDPGGRDGSWREEDGGFVDLVDGQTTTAAVDLSALLPGELDALVLHNGVPFAGALVQLRLPLTDHPDGESWFQKAVTTDSEGRFRASLRHGEYQLSGQLSADEQGAGLSAVERARVEIGKVTRQTFTLQSGRLEVSVVDAAGKPAADVAIELRDAAGVPRLTMPASDATGRATIDCDAMPFTAWVLPKRLQAPKAQMEFVQARAGQSDPFAEVRLSLGPVVVRVGETAKVELRLPAAWVR